MKDYFLNYCIKLAKKSIVRYQHASIIVQSGKIVGQGFNKLLTTGGIMNTCHAEIDALISTRKNPKILKNSTLYVIRLSGNSTECFGNSKPCLNCLSKMKGCNISRVVYSTPTGFESIFM